MSTRTEQVWFTGQVLAPRKSISADELAKCESSEEVAIKLGDYNLAMVLRRMRRAAHAKRYT